MRNKKIKILQILHHGNDADIVLGALSEKKLIVKSYHKRGNPAFLREKETLKALNHHGVIKPVFFGKTRSITANFIGKSLRAVISEGSIDTMRLVEYSFQMADALAYIHSQNIVHFDLKPENIMIAGENIKIIDFGSAKYENELITVNNFTNIYTSLEYLVGLKTAHAFKDIWSFGCIFYEMCYSKQLFTNSNTFRLVVEILGIFGSPRELGYKDLEIKHLDFFNVFCHPPSGKSEKFSKIDPRFHEILAGMLDMNPFERITANVLVDSFHDAKLKYEFN